MNLATNGSKYRPFRRKNKLSDTQFHAWSPEDPNIQGDIQIEQGRPARLNQRE